MKQKRSLRKYIDEFRQDAVALVNKYDKGIE